MEEETVPEEGLELMLIEALVPQEVQVMVEGEAAAAVEIDNLRDERRKKWFRHME